MADVDPDEERYLEWMRQLVDLEKAGERTEIKVGPFTAITLIGALQLATRHPEMQGKTRKILLDVCRQFYPLFEGTPGEEMIRRGEHPEWDK